MRHNFTKRIVYNGQTVLAVIIPQHRQNGMYYEVNVKGFPRFHVTMSPLGRYDLAPGGEVDIPYELVLAVSDAIEEQAK
jgi:hypothetical protein